MAIRVIGTAVIDDSRNLVNIVDATVTGDLTVDTNTLVVDSATNRVGIGTAGPNVDLEVSGITRSNEYQDPSGRRLLIRDSAGTIIWGD